MGRKRKGSHIVPQGETITIDGEVYSGLGLSASNIASRLNGSGTKVGQKISQLLRKETTSIPSTSTSSATTTTTTAAEKSKEGALQDSTMTEALPTESLKERVCDLVHDTSKQKGRARYLGEQVMEMVDFNEDGSISRYFMYDDQGPEYFKERILTTLECFKLNEGWQHQYWIVDINEQSLINGVRDILYFNGKKGRIRYLNGQAMEIVHFDEDGSISEYYKYNKDTLTFQNRILTGLELSKLHEGFKHKYWIVDINEQSLINGVRDILYFDGRTDRIRYLKPNRRTDLTSNFFRALLGIDTQDKTLKEWILKTRYTTKELKHKIVEYFKEKYDEKKEEKYKLKGTKYGSFISYKVTLGLLCEFFLDHNPKLDLKALLESKYEYDEGETIVIKTVRYKQKATVSNNNRGAGEERRDMGGITRDREMDKARVEDTLATTTTTDGRNVDTYMPDIEEEEKEKSRSRSRSRERQGGNKGKESGRSAPPYLGDTGEEGRGRSTSPARRGRSRDRGEKEQMLQEEIDNSTIPQTTTATSIAETNSGSRSNTPMELKLLQF